MTKMNTEQKHLTRAWIAYHQRQPLRAIEIIQPLLEKDNLHDETLFLLARCHEDNLDDEQANLCYATLYENSPTHLEYATHYADYLLRRGYFNKASSIYNQLRQQPHGLQEKAAVKAVLCAHYAGHRAHAAELLKQYRSSYTASTEWDLLARYLRIVWEKDSAFGIKLEHSQVNFPLSGHAFREESKIIQINYFHDWFFHLFRKLLEHGDVCLNIAPGVATSTAHLSVRFPEVSLIPIDHRPRAKKLFKEVISRNKCTSIDISYCGENILSDGFVAFDNSPQRMDAPLDVPVQPSSNSTHKSTCLDDLELKRIDLILNHMKKNTLLFLAGARESLTQHKPDLILLVEALELDIVSIYLEELGYQMKSGQYTNNSNTLYVFYSPR